VVDVWDALTSDRAYRPAWPPDRALRHLVAGRASHFDPVCLDAFMA
jgi:putative two-component system response regulator